MLLSVMDVTFVYISILQMWWDFRTTTSK